MATAAFAGTRPGSAGTLFTSRVAIISKLSFPNCLSHPTPSSKFYEANKLSSRFLSPGGSQF